MSKKTNFDQGFFLFRTGCYLGLILSLAYGLLGAFYKTSLAIENLPKGGWDAPFVEVYQSIPIYAHWGVLALIGLAAVLMISGGQMMLGATD